MPPTMAVTLVKSMPYRGVPEEWSNTYHLTGGNPVNDAEWNTIIDAVWQKERAIYHTSCGLVRAYGYNAGSDHANFVLDIIAAGGVQIPGTNAFTAAEKVAGDQAMTLRALIGLSTTGKKVYIRKYYHAVGFMSGDTDKVSTASKNAATTLATTGLAGFVGTGRKWCGPNGEEATLPLANPYLTTRTLKRRGKRPTTP